MQLHLFYDGDCPLCCRFGNAVARLDTAGRVALVEVHSSAAAELLGPRLSAAQEQLTVRDRLGNLHCGAQALRRLTEVLPGLRRLAWAWQLPGVTGVVGRIASAAHGRRAAHRRRSERCLECGQRWVPSRQRRRRGGRPGHG